MDKTLIVVTFFISWCIAAFLVLPFGIVTEDKPQPLHAASAPIRVGLRRKILCSAVIALLATWLITYLYQQPWMTFR